MELLSEICSIVTYLIISADAESDFSPLLKLQWTSLETVRLEIHPLANIPPGGYEKDLVIPPEITTMGAKPLKFQLDLSTYPTGVPRPFPGPVSLLFPYLTLMIFAAFDGSEGWFHGPKLNLPECEEIRHMPYPIHPESYLPKLRKLSNCAYHASFTACPNLVDLALGSITFENALDPTCQLKYLTVCLYDLFAIVLNWPNSVWKGITHLTLLAEWIPLHMERGWKQHMNEYPHDDGFINLSNFPNLEKITFLQSPQGKPTLLRTTTFPIKIKTVEIELFIYSQLSPLFKDLPQTEIIVLDGNLKIPLNKASPQQLQKIQNFKRPGEKAKKGVEDNNVGRPTQEFRETSMPLKFKDIGWL